MFKKYIWANAELHKKYKLYNNLTLVAMAGVLLCFYLLPQEFKWLNMVAIGIGAAFLFMGFKAQNQDRKIKKGMGKNEKAY
jgi:peptidoglycan/LPS O-acetylase OafA/YrhL